MEGTDLQKLGTTSAPPKQAQKSNSANTSSSQQTETNAQVFNRLYEQAYGSNSSTGVRSNQNRQNNNVNTALIDAEAQKIMQSEPGIDPKLAFERASFNATGNARVFNKYLPYRKSIENDPKKLEQYDAMIKKIMDSSIMKSSEGGFNEYSDFDDVKGQTDMDKSSKFMIAASIAELFHNRPDLVDKALNRPEKLKFGMFNMSDNSLAKATYSNDKNNAIILDKNSFWSEATNTTDGHNIAVHEFIHAVDGHGKNNRVDGLYESFTPEQKQNFLAARESLKNQHNSGTGNFFNNVGNFFQDLLSSGKATDGIGHTLSTTGLRDYAFANDHEFLTVSSEMFYDQPERLMQISPQLYSTYADFFGYDPLGVKGSKLG